MTGKPWFVLRVFANSELSAEKQLRQLGYGAMAPYWERRKRVHKVLRKWKFPLFPGYLFASWENWQAGWNHITGKIKEREADQVASVYGFLHPVWVTMPYVLPASDVEYLQGIADGKYKPDEPAKRLKVGDKVIIPEGLFQGYSGTAREVSGKNVTVDVMYEKKYRKVKISLADLGKM